MELIYFISGILTAGVLYGVKLLRNVSSSHTELLDKYDKSNAITTLRHAEMEEKVREMKLYVGDIQGKLDSDKYQETVKLKKILDTFNDDLTRIESKSNDKDKMYMKNIEDLIQEIGSIKNQLKRLGEDPNFISRY